MSESKYVILDSPTIGEFPLLFPAVVTHHFIMECIQNRYPGIKCVSAGFIDEDGNCYGRSDSLKIGSNVKDSKIISYSFPFFNPQTTKKEN